MKTGEVAEKGPIGLAPPNIRRDFVRKVYSILTVQLALTFALALPFNLMDPAWVRQQKWLYHLCMYTSLGLVLGMACCCGNAVRTFPTNYLFLFTLTVCQAVMVGFITSFYSTASVLMALATTTMVFLGLTTYACTTKSDFTGMGPYLFAALIGLICFSLILSLMSLGGVTLGGPM